MSTKKVTRTAEAPTEPMLAVFTKRQLLESERYREKRDLLGALLEDNKTYSIREADEIIESYTKGKVK